MKKFLGLVMALVMVLTAVSAFAAIPSKTTKNLATVETNAKGVTVEATENESPAVVELLVTLMENNAIPADVKKALPEGSTYTKVEEVVTLKIDGGTAEEDLVISLSFPTSFAGKKVAVLLGALDNGKIAEWKCVEATGKEDGSIDLVLPGAIQDWLNGREFVAMIAD